MIKKFFPILLLTIGIFVLVNSACRKLPEPIEEIELYSSLEEILNPPDSFIVMYSLSQYNYLEKANVIFGSDAVWSIEQVNSFSASVWVQREGDTIKMEFNEPADTRELKIGLEGGITYEFYANNNNYPETRKLHLRFFKQDDDYESFSTKL